MFSNETNLYQYLKRQAPDNHWQRLESPIVEGIPDVNVGTESLGDIWLELKIGHPKKDGTIDIILRQGQNSWLHRRSKFNQHCYVLIGIGDEIAVVKPQSLLLYSTVTTSSAEAKRRLMRLNIPKEVLFGLRVENVHKVLKI